MKPEIISRQTIKPSSPTPDSKKIYKLSLLDLLIANRIYVPIIFFYQNKEGDNSVDVAHISSGLKKSLSETLTHYYPLAGRIKDGVTVECNDEGAYFSEARIDCHLEGFLKHPEARDYLDLLMPVEIQSNSSDMGSLLLIQITFFSSASPVCIFAPTILHMTQTLVQLAYICLFKLITQKHGL
ncbi:unnamed protein product, partial [Vitis vinifera]|uniref:Uncharacterized protein n=1 Tax=Vitis vinifera TaxID=29760 RepID=D7TAL5_VITVI